ncbi:MAG: hypothetical protein HW387_1306 [Parachlamydiales bacterium]|nr:hypothetical protein [Parachlamydiales bacterium]
MNQIPLTDSPQFKNVVTSEEDELQIENSNRYHPAQRTANEVNQTMSELQLPSPMHSRAQSPEPESLIRLLEITAEVEEAIKNSPWKRLIDGYFNNALAAAERQKEISPLLLPSLLHSQTSSPLHNRLPSSDWSRAPSPMHRPRNQDSRKSINT